MKYSFMSFSCPELNLRDALALAAKLGYSGFEPRVDSKHAHGIELDMSAEARREARAIAADSEVKLCCLATSVRLASRETCAANMDDARKAIDVCVDLGIPAIRLFGGPLDEGRTRADAIENMAWALDTLSAEIGDSDVALCMETHDSWCEPAHVEAVMKLCRGKHVGVNWDLMHPALTAFADISETFSMLRPYIKHVHIHGGSRKTGLTFLPIEGSVIDHKTALAELISMGYDGYLSGEWIGWDRPNYLEEELATMRRYEEELKCTK